MQSAARSQKTRLLTRTKEWGRSCLLYNIGINPNITHAVKNLGIVL